VRSKDVIPNGAKGLREVALDAKVLVVNVVAVFFVSEKRELINMCNIQSLCMSR